MPKAMRASFSNIKPGKEPNKSYELFILLLSLLSIVNIFLPIIVKDTNVEQVIFVMDLLLSFIFMGDFIYRVSISKSRSYYILKDRGWLDFLGSLPFPALKILRIFRVIRSIRIIKKYGMQNLLDEVNKNRASAAILIVIFLIVLVLEFGGMLILAAELPDPNANIKDANDALWWIFVTITTVGYGDRYPVTTWGRIIGVLVMSCGIGLFAVLTGYLANTFLTPPVEKKPKKSPVELQLEKLTEAVEGLEKKGAKKTK